MIQQVILLLFNQEIRTVARSREKQLNLPLLHLHAQHKLLGLHPRTGVAQWWSLSVLKRSFHVKSSGAFPAAQQLRNKSLVQALRDY